MKKHKMLAEFVALKETEFWAIDIMRSVKFMQDLSKIAKKHWFEAYAKWYPKDVSDYVPTGDTIEVKTVEDIAQLSPEQFEMFIEDLRNWCNIQRGIVAMKNIWLDVSSTDWMIRLDTGLHEKKIDISMQVSNKI